MQDVIVRGNERVISRLNVCPHGSCRACWVSYYARARAKYDTHSSCDIWGMPSGWQTYDVASLTLSSTLFLLTTMPSPALLSYFYYNFFIATHVSSSTEKSA